MKPFSGGVIEAPDAALKWVLSFPDVLVLTGVEEKRFIDQNWSIFQGGYEMTDEENQKIREISKEFEKKFCRRCDYCLPCPAEIPIQFVLGIRSFIKRMGLEALQTPLFEKMLEKAADCTECGDCMERCPYSLPIPEMIKNNLNYANEVRR
jgi:predicted aldo/keto reductase-like oxidoreductase